MVIGFGIAGFKYQVDKARTLLTQALANAAIVAAAGSAGATASPIGTAGAAVPGNNDLYAGNRGFPAVGAPESSSAPKVLAICGVAALIGSLLVVNWYGNHLRSNGAYRAAVELATKSPAAQAALGSPIKAGIAVWCRRRSAPRYAMLSIPVSGPAGNGTLYVTANRIIDRWEIGRASLHTAKAALDLSPPVARETFQYPAPGGVYLQPLDDASAKLIEDYPAYYKARLESTLPCFR